DVQAQLKTALQSGVPAPAGLPKSTDKAQFSKQVADLEVEVMSLQAKEQGLQQRVARVKKSMSALAPREMEYAGLVRNVETQMKLGSILGEKLTAGRMSEQGQIRGIQVIDLAALPRQPSAKQPLKLVFVGMLAGLGLGLGAATLREYASQVVETEPQMAAATGLAVLGSIPMAPRPSGADEVTPA